ncbi:MAG: fimbria major subunit [Prevotellaceae bacterium]|nr:fimbria major subunit [Prevotellaceae bacterium]
MTFKYSIPRITLSMFLPLALLSSCGMFDSDDTECPTAQDSKGYISVQVGIAADETTRSTRAEGDNPYGGEDGNGREAAYENEYKVSNVTLLLYQSANGINGTGTETIEYAYYFSTLTKSSTTATGYDIIYKSSAQECNPLIITSGNTYHVIVIANCGDLTSTFSRKTLADVRDYLFESAWTYAEGAYSDFVMTSEDDATTEGAKGAGTETDPLVVSVDIERLAARIDIEPGDGTYSSNDGTSSYNYNVVSNTDESRVVGGFVLEAILPYNKLESGEYLIKRVTNGINTSSLLYLGDETATSNKATNYVLDPWTLAKAANNATNLTYNQSKESDWTNISGFIDVKAVEDGQTYFILDYTMENTTTDNSDTYSTGLVFKGTYYEGSDWDSANKTPVTGAKGTEKYYTYTIRHSDPEGEGTVSDPMYYGIVRNNIYRVKVNKIQGTASEPEITLTINVRKWATYTHSEIVM